VKQRRPCAPERSRPYRVPQPPVVAGGCILQNRWCELPKEENRRLRGACAGARKGLSVEGAEVEADVTIASAGASNEQVRAARVATELNFRQNCSRASEAALAVQSFAVRQQCRLRIQSGRGPRRIRLPCPRAAAVYGFLWRAFEMFNSLRLASRQGYEIASRALLERRLSCLECLPAFRHQNIDLHRSAAKRSCAA